jgi:DNA-binding Lrp family transcriptional regulator
MKDLKPKLIELFKEGNCTPQISVIAKKLHEPSTTIHYNIKRLEQEGAIKAYKAVLDYKSVNLGYCSFVLINLSEEDYSEPEKVAKEIAKDAKVESVDISSGEQDILVKLRTKDIEEYYEVIKNWIKKFKLKKVSCINSLKQIKTEFVNLD